MEKVEQNQNSVSITLGENQSISVLYPKEVIAELSEGIDLDVLKEKYAGVQVSGVKDVQQYELAKEGHILLKKLVSGVEKARKKIKDPVMQYGKWIDDTAKTISGAIVPLRDHLAEQRSNYEDEVERIQKEEEEKEKARIQGRKDALFAAGCMFDGEKFRIQDHGINEMDVFNLDDKEFDQFISTATVIQKKIQDKEEAEKKELEELRALKAERDAKLEQHANRMSNNGEKTSFTPIQDENTSRSSYEKTISQFDTLKKIVEQLEFGNYTNEQGVPLVNNVAFIALKRMAER